MIQFEPLTVLTVKKLKIQKWRIKIKIINRNRLKRVFPRTFRTIRTFWQLGL